MATGTYEITHEKILESGKKFFLKNGYERTNLRELCKGAGITTGAYYRHFPDKESLFAALVEPAVKGIRNMYAASETQCFDYIQEKNLRDLFNVSDETVRQFIKFIYANFDCFKLLLQCSDGTPYVTFTNDMVELEVENSLKMVNAMQERGILVRSLKKNEFHMLNHAYFACIFEAVIHDYTEEEALEYTHTMVEFFVAGWKKVLGL